MHAQVRDACCYALAAGGMAHTIHDALLMRLESNQERMRNNALKRIGDSI